MDCGTAGGEEQNQTASLHIVTLGQQMSLQSNVSCPQCYYVTQKTTLTMTDRDKVHWETLKKTWCWQDPSLKLRPGSKHINRHIIVTINQRFSIPVLAPPPLCIFCMLLLSLQMFVLLERKCSAKWTSQDIPLWFQFEANVYIPFKVHWSVRDVN